VNIDHDVAARAVQTLALHVARRHLARQPVDDRELRALLEQQLSATPTADLIGADAAAAILHCGPREVRRKAERLGGIRISGAWCFTRATIEEFARRPPERTYRKRPPTD
jgi:hypothetical protein